jgi:RNA polymerase sigma-70 factor (ECF subfamily)
LKDELLKPAEGLDITLVRKAQAGDGEAFTELFQQLHAPVLNYVFRTVGDRQAAEDITQDAFIRAHQRIGQLGPPYDFKSWVFRIASNLAIDNIRQSKRFIDLDEEVEPLGPMTTKRPAERKVQQEQLKQSVEDTLALMPTVYRQAIVLRELNGLGYQEVASALECTYDNARQLVHRARLNFRELHGLRLLAASGAVQCREIGSLLSALQDGELSTEDRRAVRKHIKSCKHCQETEKDLRKVAGLMAGLAPILPSPDWVQAVTDTLQSQELGSAPAQPAPAPSASPSAAAASSGAPPGTAAGMSWLVKAGIGASAALIGGGALVAAGAWAFNQYLGAPEAPDPSAVEQTVQAIVDLTPPAVTQIIEPATEEPPPPPPLPPIADSPTPTREEMLVVEGPPIAIALMNSNCRSGPGSIYDVVDYLLEDDQTPILGRDAQWFWWVVGRKGHPGTCWVANNLVDEKGDTSQVPVVMAPPTPTPADNQAPVLALSHTPKNPLSNEVVSFNVTATDPSGVAWIEIWVRAPGQSAASLLGKCDNNTCRLQGGPYTAGKGEYFARAEDAIGNYVESGVYTFDVSWYIG